MGDDRPPVYYEDNELIIRASAIGNPCLFDLVAAGQNHPPSPIPQSLQKAFDDGTRLEDVVIERMVREYGCVFLETQTEGELEVGEKDRDEVKVRYHPDGIVNLGSQFYLTTHLPNFYNERELPPRTVVAEIKALSDGLWQRFVKGGMESVIDEYPWQLSVMMIDRGLPGLWVGLNKGRREKGEKVECKDEGKLHFQLVTIPPVHFGVIVDKARKVKELVDGEDILTSGQECNSPDHWPCRYLHLRPQTTPLPSQDSTELADDDKDRFDNLVKQYLFHKGQEEEHKNRREAAKLELIEMAGKRKGKVKSDKWIVPVHVGHGGKKLRWKDMPDELKEELKQYEEEGAEYLYLRDIRRLD